MAAAGVLLGGLLSLWPSRLLDSQLFDTSTRDGLTFAVVALAMLTVAAVASWLPARRATRVDPVEVLRAE